MFKSSLTCYCIYTDFILTIIIENKCTLEPKIKHDILNHMQYDRKTFVTLLLLIIEMLCKLLLHKNVTFLTYKLPYTFHVSS